MNKSLCLLALLTLLLSGCVQRVEPTGAAGGGAPVNLVLYTWSEATEQAANQELVNQFEKAQPGITVQIQNVPGSQEAMQKLQTMMAAGTAPDVMSIHGAYYFSFAAKGTLADLEPFATKDASFNLADFYPSLVQISRWQGKLYSLPRYTSVYELFYNKSLFDAAGLPYPGTQGHWTWDDYLADARKLTTQGPGGAPGVWGVFIDFWGSRLFPWLWQNNADLLDPSRTHCTLDSPQAVEAITFLRDLRWKYGVAPASISSGHNDGINLFLQGQVGMYMTGPWDVQTLQKKPALKWDVAPLPVKQRPATLLGTENYGISATTKHPQEAWELFKFLLSPESQAFMAQRLERMPSRRSVAEGPYLSAPASYNRKVFVDALSYALAAPNIPEWDQVAHPLQEQMDLIWINSKTPAQGLHDAAEQMNATLAKLRGR